MRLLNTATLKFQEFFDDQIPPYSILSHRWTTEEVSHEQHRAGQILDGGYGNLKIAELCEISRNDGIAWTWIDTCCIDKRSSAELSEAINSMFNWYKKAQVCYAFLADVHPVADQADVTPAAYVQPQNESLKQVTNISYVDAFLEPELRRSEWFQRGWTLQELLAPKYVLFFNSDFRLIGDRNGLAGLISTITGIAEVPLAHMNGTTMNMTTMGPAGPCFAEKMSWAAGRQTSRKEDIAYCLMGLVDVNMPLLYGEGGQRAFARLQQEYLVRNLDDSIFAWDEARTSEKGILAPNPSAFEGCGAFMISANRYGSRLTRGISNLGIELELPVPRFVAKSSEAWPIMYSLDCRDYQTSDQVEMEGPSPGVNDSGTNSVASRASWMGDIDSTFHESQYMRQRLPWGVHFIQMLQHSTGTTGFNFEDFSESLRRSLNPGIGPNGLPIKAPNKLFRQVIIQPSESSVWIGYIFSTLHRRLWTQEPTSGQGLRVFRRLDSSLEPKEPHESIWLDMQGNWLKEPTIRQKFATLPHISQTMIKSWEESDPEKLVQEAERWDNSVVFRKIAFSSEPMP